MLIYFLSWMTMNQIYIYIFLQYIVEFFHCKHKMVLFNATKYMETFQAYFKTNLIITLLNIFSYGQCFSVFFTEIAYIPFKSHCIVLALLLSPLW